MESDGGRGAVTELGRVPISLVARLERVDPIARAAQDVVRRLAPRGGTLADLLAGTWLGHPLHPLLTDVAIGSWTSAWLLDMTGGKRARRPADRLVAVGVASALPAAAAGLSDWADTSGEARRVGAVHAAGNTLAIALYAASLGARRRGRRRLGVALGTLGATAASGAGWLGGHLAFRLGVGVDETAFERLPAEWAAVEGAPPEEGSMRRVTAGETAVLLVTSGGTTYAMVDRCSHRGCSLADGSLEDGLVVCACHGSTFALDGTLRRGPATASQPALDVRRHDGVLQVRAATGRP
jgi:nitrite reductase/ring-hydroxylating ferredoxin subunit